MTNTLFIGLDGATFTVLDEMMRDDPSRGVVMPFLANLVGNGVRAKLLSTPNPLTPPAWVSMMTGRTPGNHGVFDFIRSEDKGSEVYFTLYDARDIACETVWSIASRKDKTVVALNFPMTSPPKDINGCLVPGFVPWKHLRRNTRPRELYERLKSLPEFDPRQLAWDFEREKKALEALDESELEEWVRYHLPREEQWFKIARHLLVEEKPDLMAVLFDGVDKIQHQAWQFIDPGRDHSADGDFEKRMREVCYQYFRSLDGYIKELVTLAGPAARVFLASDHGFTSSEEVLRINTYLHEMGYLQWKEDGDAEITERRNNSNFANVDWARTTAYCRTPSSNGIAIRVAHQPGDAGVPVAEYDAFRDRLIADLEALMHPETGEQVIAKVMKREDCFPGQKMSEAPDLTLVLKDHGFVSIRNLPGVIYKRPGPAGTHHPDGVFIGHGPGLRQGARMERRDIHDVGPVLLHSLGLDVPKDMEGKVPAEAYTDVFLAGQPIHIGDSTYSTGTRTGEDIDEAEKEKIMAQLKMLGYLE